MLRRECERRTGYGIMPFSASSRRAFSFLSRSQPIARITCGALVNWILEYSTTSTRLPQGSRKSRKGPGSSLPPAASTRERTLERSSTTSPKWRRRSSCGSAVHHVDELVAELDKGVARPFGPEREVEDLAVKIESLIDVADLDRDVIDADEPRLAGLAHVLPPGRCQVCRL